jgi:hypothetical protein
MELRSDEPQQRSPIEVLITSELTNPTTLRSAQSG